MKDTIYQNICRHAANGKKQLCLLIDPDKYTDKDLMASMQIVNRSAVDLIFVGGSLLVDNRVGECIRIIKDSSDVPVVLFPGSPAQIHEEADAILLLSLISGRNADLLIGRHVEAAPMLRKSGLEIISTGYMLVDSGQQTTASYISNTVPIPHNKADIAACTAMAGEMLGLKLLYLDGGSGAQKPVSAKMIAAVKEHTNLPLVIGGGIRSQAQLREACAAGADVVVIGNILESEPELLYDFGQAINAPA
jgi:putative glycerol-1-phosphate prenyltransferase